MKLSVVIPVYNEEDCLEALYSALEPVLHQVRNSAHEANQAQVILVNDGSTDRSSSIIEELHQRNSHWMGLHLSRNFGQQAAYSAGLDHADGDAVILMDADLQDRPELIPTMLDLWRQGNKVVYVVRKSRGEGLLKEIVYGAFYKLLNSITSPPISKDSGDFSLLDKEVADVLRSMPERSRFLRGIRAWVGFKQIGLEVHRPARTKGNTKFSFFALVNLASNGIMDFSWAPLRIMTIFGFFGIFLGFVYAAVILYLKITGAYDLPGWSTLALLLVLSTSINLLAFGVLGEYVGRVFKEVKQRPTYIVSKIDGEIKKSAFPSSRNH